MCVWLLAIHFFFFLLFCVKISLFFVMTCLLYVMTCLLCVTPCQLCVATSLVHYDMSALCDVLPALCDNFCDVLFVMTCQLHVTTCMVFAVTCQLCIRAGFVWCLGYGGRILLCGLPVCPLWAVAYPFCVVTCLPCVGRLPALCLYWFCMAICQLCLMTCHFHVCTGRVPEVHQPQPCPAHGRAGRAGGRGGGQRGLWARGAWAHRPLHLQHVSLIKEGKGVLCGWTQSSNVLPLTCELNLETSSSSACKFDKEG